MKKIQRKVQVEVSFVEALALSLMAYRLNSNEYVKSSQFVVDMDRNVTVCEPSNRDIILFNLPVNMPNLELIPETYKQSPTEEDYKIAKEMVAYYGRLTFAALSGKINDFETKVLAFVQNGKVTEYDVGIVASLPSSYFQAIKRESVKAQQEQLAQTSRFIGQVGKSTVLTIDVMSVNYVQSLGCWAVNAKDSDNNLLMFFTGKEEFKETAGQTLNISGVVKRQQKNNFHGGNETVLNRVKTV